MGQHWKVRVTRTLAVVTLLLLGAAAVSAQSLSPELAGAVRAYKLDTTRATAILKSLEELNALVLKNPEATKRLAATMKGSTEERIKQMEQDASTAAILRANRLTGREYFVGLMALRAAAGAATGQQGGLTAMASRENVAFVKANAAIAERLRKADLGR